MKKTRLYLASVLILVGVLSIGAAPAAGQTVAFNPPVNISNAPGSASDQSSVAIDGATMYVAWRQEIAAGQQIRLRRSPNNGASFIDGPAGRVVASVDPAETVYTVRIAAFGSQVYVLYTSGLEPRVAKARLARSLNGGLSFAAPVALADLPEYGGCASADFAVDAAGTVHIVCEDREASDRIHYLFSTDGGETFSAPAPLSHSTTAAVSPRVAVRGPRLAVVWEARPAGDAGAAADIGFIYSDDGGETFGPALNLSGTPAASERPAVAIGNTILMVWVEGNAVAIRSSVDGAAFSSIAAVATAPSGAAIAGVSVGSANNTVHVSWAISLSDEIMDGPFYRRSIDAGGSFGTIQDLRLGLEGVPFGVPAVLHTTQARLVWPHSPTGFAGDADVVFAGEASCGSSWAAPVSGNWGVAANWSPAVVPSAGSTVCIMVEGDYTVTIDGNRSAATLTIGHALSTARPTVRIMSALTIGSSLVNAGVLTFGVNGAQLASATGAVVNTERGLLTTLPGVGALLNAGITNYGEVLFAANVTTVGTARVFTNQGRWRIAAGATQTMGPSWAFVHEQGVLTVNGAAVMSSADFYFLGGHIEGFVTHVGGVTRLRVSADGAGEFRFRQTNQGELYGRLAAGQTVRILGTSAGSATVTAQPGFANDGTIILGPEPGTTTTQSATLAGTTATLVNRGTIIVEAGGGGRRIDTHIENYGTFDVQYNVGLFGASGRTFTNYGTMTVADGAAVTFGTNFVFTQNAGVIQNAGTVELSAEFSTGGDWFIFNGGTIDGVILIRGHSHLRIGPGSTGAGTFQFERNASSASFGGDIAPAQTLRIVGTQIGSTAHSGVVTAANGFTNAGTIVLDRLGGLVPGGATFVITTGTFVNTGSFIADGAVSGGLRLDGHAVNRGTVDVRRDLGLFGANGRTFTNEGTMRVAEGAAVSFGANFVFNQNDGLLQNAGTMVMSAEFSTGGDWFIFNGGSIEGVIVIQGHSHLRIGPGSTGPGTFQFERNSIFGVSANATFGGNVAPGQTLRILGTQVGSTAHSGSVVAASGFTNAGTIVMDSVGVSTGGQTLVITAGTLVNTGLLRVGADGPAKSIRAHLQNHGTADVEGWLSLGLGSGTFTNTGALTIGPAGRITLGPGGVVNQNAGTMTLDGRIELAQEFSTAQDVFNFNGGAIVGAAGVHLIGRSDLNIGAGAADGAGRFVFRAAPSGIAQLTGNVGPNHVLTLQGGGVVKGTALTNAGTIALLAEGANNAPSLAVTTGVLVNTGTISIDPIATVAPLNAVLDNRGRLDIRHTMSLTRASAVHANHGVIDIAAGRTLTLTGSSTFRNFATGSFEGGGQLTVASGSTLAGVGTLGVTVTNAGRVRPGLSPGILAITGNYSQTGQLEIEITGNAPGTGYDRLDVGGAATLGGTLAVIVAPGACVQDTYTIMTYGSVGTADFAVKTGLTGLAGGRSLQASKQATEYRLNAAGASCNAAPVAADDDYAVDEDATLVIDAPGVLANDTDPDDDSLTAILVTGASHGVVTLAANGGFTYVPAENYHGPDSFTYRASDGQGTSGIATVTIQVNPVADPPLAGDDAIEMDEDGGAAVIDVLANDSPGPDGGTLVITTVTPAAHGTTAIVAGSVQYTPGPNFNGVDTFTYTLEDGLGGVASATVTVTVRPVNDAPSLASLADLTTAPGTPVAFTLAATDVDGDALVFSGAGLPQGATLDSASGAFAWTPSAADAGSHALTFTVTDPGGLTASRSITITVTTTPVQWPFSGFLSPVSNPPTINIARGGSAIPMKFSLGGDRGLTIFVPGSPWSGRISCATGAGENDAIETTTAGQSTLTYDAAADRYAYVWKTDSAWAGTCRQFGMQLADGSTYTAIFRFR